MSTRNRREIGKQIRWLSLMTAAAHTGANGGDAAKKLLRELERELRAYGGASAGPTGEPESGMPLNQEQFEKMMMADGG